MIKVNRDPRFLIFQLVFLILLALYFTGCSKKSDAPPTDALSCATLAGHYTRDLNPTDTLDIANNCTFTDSVCGYDASYTVPDAQGNTIISVVSTNGTPGCMSPTDHVCAFGSLGNQISIDCDGGAVFAIFTKQ
jgi:hypothetical protein